MGKLMGKREKFFALVLLFLTNIFCIIKFFITFIKNTNYFNYLELQQEINKEEISYFDEIVNFKELGFTKVLLIVSISLTILLALYSLILLFIKNSNIKKNLLLISFTFAFLVILFYFTGRLSAGDLYTKSIANGSYSDYRICLCETEYYNNALFMIASILISIISTFLCFSISNDIYKNKNSEEIIEEENQRNNNFTEETMLEEEIKKLKAQVKIKNLEEEYLKLKEELNTPHEIKKTKKTQ